MGWRLRLLIPFVGVGFFVGRFLSVQETPLQPLKELVLQAGAVVGGPRLVAGQDAYTGAHTHADANALGGQPGDQ